MSKIMEILLVVVSIGIVGLEMYSLVNYFSRPKDYRCTNGTITSERWPKRNDTCADALRCSDEDTYRDYIEITNRGDLLFEIILCFYLLLSTVLTLAELCLVCFKNKEVHIFIKCLDYIAFVVLTVFQAPLCADYGKCISMKSGWDYIKFVSSTYGTIYLIFLVVILFGSFSGIVTAIALGYYIYLNVASLKYQYAANYSSVTTAVLISVKHFLTFVNVGVAIVNFCRKRRNEARNEKERVVTTA